MTTGPTPLDTTLSLDRVSKRYGDVIALQELTFDVRPGEIFGFVGSNGAGKTTAMRISMGVLAADSGTVRIGGNPMDLALRRSIGYMPEERGLYPKMKVGPQLTYLAQLHGMSATDARDAARHWARRLGVEQRLDDSVQALSLGNQQRVQLAAALVHDPSVLILDEPFSGLDPVAVDVMSEVLAEKAATGVPVVFSSHQLDLVQRLCDRVGIITRGQLRALGTVDELRERGTTLIEVVAPQAPPDWAAQVPGVRVLSRSNGQTTVELTTDVDDQLLLAAALRTGPVHRFAARKPDLTELFREVVSA